MFYNFYNVLYYNFKRTTYLKERRKEKLWHSALSLLLSTHKFKKVANGISPLLLHLNIFFSASMHLRELYAQEDQVLILIKTITFQSWINFLLSFGFMSNHKDTNVYKRKVVGLCNQRMWRDHPFCQKHGLRSILVENETVPLDKIRTNGINNLKRIH